MMAGVIVCGACHRLRLLRTHGCTRPVLFAKQRPLRRKGLPHMPLISQCPVIHISMNPVIT